MAAPRTAVADAPVSDTLSERAATLVQRYLLSFVAVRFDTSALDFLTGRLLDLPMTYFNSRRTGDIERRLAALENLVHQASQKGERIETIARDLCVKFDALVGALTSNEGPR